jgi:hypothetical protein
VIFRARSLAAAFGTCSDASPNHETTHSAPGMTPFKGGYALAPGPHLTCLREATYDDFLAAVDGANVAGRELLAKVFSRLRQPGHRSAQEQGYAGVRSDRGTADGRCRGLRKDGQAIYEPGYLSGPS